VWSSGADSEPGIGCFPSPDSSEFSLPPECCPTNPSRLAAARRLLSWTLFSLQHNSEPKVHFLGKLPPLPTFHLQGLATLLVVSSLRFLVSLVSYSPRSWDSPLRSTTWERGSATFPSHGTHMPFARASYATNMTVARRHTPRLLGFDPRPKPKTASTRGTLSPAGFHGVLPF
jgi:hypothetical protein